MATWNADEPAVGNQITVDIASIEENFQELHDVITAITNGTLGTTTASDFRIDAGSTPLIWLKDSRARFEWKDADEIYIHAGAYHHVGTVSQIVYWNSKLTSDIGSPDASDWYYLYLDDSAIVTAGTNLLTTSELLWSNTEPAWSETKHGWYNGEDRAIFAVLTDGSSNILEFVHDGGDECQFATDIASLAATATSTTWTDATLKAPKFATKVGVTFVIVYVDGNSVFYWRTNGQTDTTGKRIAFTALGTNYSSSAVITDSSQIIEVHYSGAGGLSDTIAVYTYAWYFPAGM